MMALLEQARYMRSAFIGLGEGDDAERSARKIPPLLLIGLRFRQTEVVGWDCEQQVRADLLAVGCAWFMARSLRAALAALHRSGVPFRRSWRASHEVWEGPFDGSEKRLPQLPEVRSAAIVGVGAGARRCDSGLGLMIAPGCAVASPARWRRSVAGRPFATGGTFPRSRF